MQLIIEKGWLLRINTIYLSRCPLRSPVVLLQGIFIIFLNIWLISTSSHLEVLTYRAQSHIQAAWSPNRPGEHNVGVGPHT